MWPGHHRPQGSLADEGRGEEAGRSPVGHIGLELMTMEVNTEILSEKNR